MAQSYELFALYYRETQLVATAQPEELLTMFDGFLDRTASRSELYVHFKTLYLLAQLSGNPDVPVSFALDAERREQDVKAETSEVVRAVLAGIGAGAARRQSVSAMVDSLGISQFADQTHLQQRNFSERSHLGSVEETPAFPEMHVPFAVESWQSFLGWSAKQRGQQAGGELALRSVDAGGKQLGSAGRFGGRARLLASKNTSKKSESTKAQSKKSSAN